MSSNGIHVRYVAEYEPEGISLGTSVTKKVSVYGVAPVIQAVTIAAVSGAGANAATTALDALIVACKNFGIIASA